MSTEIVPLEESHAEGASRMVAARYREGRDILPLLQEQYVHGEAVLPKVLDLVGSNAGVATVRGGELRGGKPTSSEISHSAENPPHLNNLIVEEATTYTYLKKSVHAKSVDRQTHTHTLTHPQEIDIAD